MPRTADRTFETTATTGTGTLTLAGAKTGFRTFAAAFSVGDQIFYCIELAAQWEVGVGTLLSATTLSRDTILSSSASGAAVSFSAGAKNVFSTMPTAVRRSSSSFLLKNAGIM